MNIYRVEKTHEIITHADLVRRNKNTSVPCTLDDVNEAFFGVRLVYPGAQPAPTPTTYVAKGPIVENALGRLEQQYVLVPKYASAEEEAAALHEQENMRLSAIKANIVAGTQKRLDDFAATRGYGDARTSPIVSACSYAAGDDTRCGPEGRYCLRMRIATWNRLYEILAEIESGQRVVPEDYIDIEGELPLLDWNDI